MERFQQQLVSKLSQNNLTVQVLCFMTHPLHRYHIHVSRHLEMMQELFIEHECAHIVLPALQQKPDDIPLLAQHFIRQFSYHHSLNQDAKEALQTLHWERNMKDLQQVCFELAQINDTSEIYNYHVHDTYNALFKTNSLSQPQIASAQQPSMTVPLLDSKGNLRLFSDIEEDVFRMACQYRRGSKSSAARDLGIGRTTLYRKLKSNN